MNKKIIIDKLKDWKKIQKNKSYDNFTINPKITISGNISNIPPEPQPTLKDVLVLVKDIQKNQLVQQKIIEEDHKLLVETKNQVEQDHKLLVETKSKLDTVIKVNHLKTK